MPSQQQQQQQQQQQKQEEQYQQLKKQQQRQKIQQDLQRRIGEYASSYPLSISFPASVASSLSSIVSPSNNEEEKKTKDAEKDKTKPVPLRTNSTFVQHRLMESGVFFDVDMEDDDEEVTTNMSFYQTMGDVSFAISSFISDMNSTGCYDSVKVVIQPDEEKQQQYYKLQAQQQQQQQQQINKQQDIQHCKLQVLLKEKKWYNLYAGGGFKHETSSSATQDLSSSTVPKIQFETRAGLLNLTGHTDTTSLSYTIDQTSSTTWSLLHDRPLYSLFSSSSPSSDSILEALGSRMNVQFRGVVDTEDFEFSRSYKELKRLVGVRISNVKSSLGDEASGGVYKYLDYTTTHRDILPRKHATIPYCSAASPEIVSQSGQSYKHSLSYSYKMNNSACDDRFNPTEGYDVHYDVEVAGPPGDVGFIKGSGGMAIHVPLVSPPAKKGNTTNLVRNLLSDLSFHGIVNCGYIRPITYGGLCPPVTNVADRFFVGGPLQLRGFLPAGIGPRAETGGPSTPGGDAMGGDFYYTLTAATSIPFPGIPFLRNNGIRLMGFANAGTLTSLNGYSGSNIPVQSILKSTRVAVGGGITMGLGIGRLEATYAVPIRYGPRDARKNAQFGLGFNIG